MGVNFYRVTAPEAWEETLAAQTDVKSLARVATGEDVAFVDPTLTFHLKRQKEDAARRHKNIKEAFDAARNAGDFLKQYQAFSHIQTELEKETTNTQKNVSWLEGHAEKTPTILEALEKDWIAQTACVQGRLMRDHNDTDGALFTRMTSLIGRCVTEGKIPSVEDASLLMERHTSTDKDRLQQDISTFLSGGFANRFYACLTKNAETLARNTIKSNKSFLTHNYVEQAQSFKIAAESAHKNSLEEKNALASAPSYDPDAFDRAAEGSRANCYAYAVNDPAGHLGKSPDPGDKRHAPVLHPGAGLHIAALAEKDGLSPTNKPTPKEGHYLVALAVSPEERDYHWMRQDNDGTWSHKIANKMPRKNDMGGKPIIDPQTADWGKYTHFVGYFYAPEGGLEVGYKTHEKFAADIDAVKKDPARLFGTATQERVDLGTALRAIAKDGSFSTDMFQQMQEARSGKKRETEARFRQERHDRTRLPVDVKQLNAIIRTLAQNNKETIEAISSLPAYQAYVSLDEKGQELSVVRAAALKQKTVKRDMR